MEQLEQRYWEKVDRRNPVVCWNWEAYCNPNGYGRFNLNGDIKGAHQVAWMLQHKKKIPYSLCVLHKCDNPYCVNPKHLYLGDQKQNALDRKTRGREGDHKGIKNGRAKKEISKIEYHTRKKQQFFYLMEGDKRRVR